MKFIFLTSSDIQREAVSGTGPVTQQISISAILMTFLQSRMVAATGTAIK